MKLKSIPPCVNADLAGAAAGAGVDADGWGSWAKLTLVSRDAPAIRHAMKLFRMGTPLRLKLIDCDGGHSADKAGRPSVSSRFHFIRSAASMLINNFYWNYSEIRLRGSVKEAAA